MAKILSTFKSATRGFINFELRFPVAFHCDECLSL